MMIKLVNIFVVALVLISGLMAKQTDNAERDLMAEYHRALLKIGDNKLNEGEEQLKKIVTCDPGFYRAYPKLVLVAKRKSNFPSLLAFLDDLKVKFPNNGVPCYGLGMVYRALKQYPKAVNHFKDSLILSPDFAEGYRMLINTWLRIKKGTEPIGREIENYLDNAGRQQGDNPLLLYTRGYLYSKQKKFFHAGELLTRVIAKKPLLWQPYDELATVYTRQNRRSDQMAVYKKLHRVAEGIRDLELLARMQTNIGIIHCLEGRFEQAVTNLENSVVTFRKTGHRLNTGRVLLNLAIAYNQLGLFEKSNRVNRQALEIFTRLGREREQGIILANIGATYDDMRDRENALSYYKKALLVQRKTRDRSTERITLGNIGNLFRLGGEYDKAREYLQLALDVKESLRETTGYVLNNFGALYIKTGEYAKAETHYKKGLAVGEKMPNAEIMWTAQAGLGEVYWLQNKRDRSLAITKKAIGTIESIRSQLHSHDFKTSFMDSRIAIYDDMIRRLYQSHQLEPVRGYDRHCFYYIERAKARSFLDRLQEAKIDLSSRISTDLKKGEQKISSEITRLQTQLVKNDNSAEKRHDISRQLENLEQEYQKVILRIKKEHPAYSAIVYPEASTLEEIRRHLLEKKDALMEYYIGGSEVFLVVITANDLFLYKLTAADQLLERTRNYLNLVARSSGGNFMAVAAAKRLYKELLGPFAAKLSQYERLIIAPDRMLHYLPFETLMIAEGRGAGRFLGEDHILSYIPSASAQIAHLTRPIAAVPTRDFLAFADPVYRMKETPDLQLSDAHVLRRFSIDKGFNFLRLPHSGNEVNSAAKYFPASKSTILVREQAREEWLKELKCIDYRVIHFATHGLLDERFPARSALVFSLDNDPRDDGFLQVREIYSTKINTELAVLSACNTGKGMLQKGEGVTGLYRAFLYAGARSVVMSLWNINDRATARFMEFFYGHLDRGRSKESALQRAKKDMLQTPYRHPFYWAAFVLTGESRSQIK